MYSSNSACTCKQPEQAVFPKRLRTTQACIEPLCASLPIPRLQLAICQSFSWRMWTRSRPPAPMHHSPTERSTWRLDYCTVQWPSVKCESSWMSTRTPWHRRASLCPRPPCWMRWMRCIRMVLRRALLECQMQQSAGWSSMKMRSVNGITYPQLEVTSSLRIVVQARSMLRSPIWSKSRPTVFLWPNGVRMYAKCRKWRTLASPMTNWSPERSGMRISMDTFHGSSQHMALVKQVPLQRRSQPPWIWRSTWKPLAGRVWARRRHPSWASPEATRTDAIGRGMISWLYPHMEGVLKWNWKSFGLPGTMEDIPIAIGGMFDCRCWFGPKGPWACASLHTADVAGGRQKRVWRLLARTVACSSYIYYVYNHV